MSSKTSSYRASTAHVELRQIQERLLEIQGHLQLGQTSNDDEALRVGSEESLPHDDAGTCEYDLSKHVLSYLPTPVVSSKEQHLEEELASEAEDGEKKEHGAGFFEGAKHLGLQTDLTRKSIFQKNPMMECITDDDICTDPVFDSMFRPEDMRLLALVSHNNMKQSMKQFVIANMNVLKKFRLTGTNTTMSMLREVFGDDPSVVYGPSCKSGPLGGDAQLVALAVTGQVGGCIFFIDPMDAHPHSADIECLVRQGNVHNILMANNPCTAHIIMNTFRVALKMGRMEMIPSFFFDLESPSVDAYKKRQKAVLDNAIGNRVSIVASRISATVAPTREKKIHFAMEKANQQRASFLQTGALPKGLGGIDDFEEIPTDEGKKRGCLTKFRGKRDEL
eukprot:CAMPEP_0203639254 /NCGR_PEP_ID=MMETSP0088-20131115/5053_1 /ASSEMBLY_ACC=CAM_ASM_001087 /TAXON_ID=426623 /ORGANISM="Chaetoceros affinis, Strain CCMP159" /LENGTH=391 /DNA_ID=CAMNT_0050494091 /DNA_START=215 /DNA_END=1390 /DNA_ORIENTATION=-